MSNEPVQLLGGDPTSIGDAAVFGVITVSDRASTGVYQDLSGPAILRFFQEAIQSTWEAKYVVIPDEQPLIEKTIKDMVRLLALGQIYLKASSGLLHLSCLTDQTSRQHMVHMIRSRTFRHSTHALPVALMKAAMRVSLDGCES